MLVWRTERPSQKNVLPIRLQLARSEEESIWKASVLPIAMRSCFFSDIRNDGDVGREVEVNWKRDEFVKWKEVFSFDERNVKDEDYC